MNDAELSKFLDERWAELDEPVRHEAVAHLKEELGVEVLNQIREAHEADPINWFTAYHHGWGTEIRNFLRREVRKDEQLPSGNWDDYYVQALETAAGVRAPIPQEDSSTGPAPALTADSPIATEAGSEIQSGDLRSNLRSEGGPSPTAAGLRGTSSDRSLQPHNEVDQLSLFTLNDEAGESAATAEPAQTPEEPSDPQGPHEAQ